MKLWCSQHEGWLDEICFRDKNDLRLRGQGRKKNYVCKFCLIDNRTDKAHKDPWYTKAYACTCSHTKSYNLKNGLRLKTSEYATHFLWEVDKIAHQMEHAWGNGCWNCNCPYQGMPSGMAALTVDIWDPREEPYWANNTRLLCSSCNLMKGDLTPEEFAVIWAGYQERKEQLKKPKTKRLVQHDLFFLAPEQIKHHEFEHFRRQAIPSVAEPYVQEFLFA